MSSGAKRTGWSNSRQTEPTPSTTTATTEDVLKLFEPFVGYFALDPELSREYTAIIDGVRFRATGGGR